MMQILWFLIKAILVLLLPFIVLIRGAVFLHANYGLLPSISLIGGVIITAFLLFIYLSIVYSKFTKKVGNASSLKGRALLSFLLVAIFTIHGLSFFNTDNLKSKEVRSEIHDLHPILRLGTSTFTFLDKNLVVTDASRIPEDYRKMGLRTPNNSLHFTQKDGYAYAVDLRTKGRPEFINKATTLYFRLMGFNTLRHVGTEDHLHISLYCHYHKKAI